VGTPTRELRLLGGLEALEDGRPVVLAQAAARMVAYLAVHGRTSRTVLAARLWPDQARAQGLANVRTVLWRMRSSARWVQTPGTSIELAPDVVVDAHVLRTTTPHDAAEALDRLLTVSTDDLLPEWSEEWVDIERERLRELHVRGLVGLGRELVEAGDPDRALAAGYRAVQLDPLRESSHRLLVEVHLAEGDYALAQRCYEAYRALLLADLGVLPSPRMHDLVARIPRRRAPAVRRSGT
jgi:DNA-binding SARP family transcriptional activator